jgi:hypothetical protein
VIVVWSYTLWPITFAIATWSAYARHAERLAGVLTTLTFLPVLLLILKSGDQQFPAFLRYSPAF